MKNKIQKNKLGLLLLIAAVMVSLPIISAVGISSDYFVKNPITAYPGETKVVVFGRLQNMVGGKDLILNAEIIEGKDIATILDKNAKYSVPFGRADIPVNVRISIPAGTPLGIEYSLNIRFLDVTPTAENSGTITLSTSSSRRIPVVVVAKPLPLANNATPIQEPEKNAGNALWTLVGIILIIAIIIVIFLILKERNRTSRRRRR